MRLHSASQGPILTKAAKSARHSDVEGQPSGVLCEPLITSQQFGKILGLHPKVVERMAKRGEVLAWAANVTGNSHQDPG